MNLNKASKIVDKAERELRKCVCKVSSCPPDCPLQKLFRDEKGYDYCPYTIIALVSNKIKEKSNEKEN